MPRRRSGNRERYFVAREMTMSVDGHLAYKAVDCGYPLLLPASIAVRIFVILDSFLFAVIAKLPVVGILFFRTDGQDGIEFF